MQTEAYGLVIFGITALAVLVPLWLMTVLSRRCQERELLVLNKMHRFALRHNTFVRNLQGTHYVVVLGKNGFCLRPKARRASAVRP